MPVSVSVSSVEWVRHVAFTGVVGDDDLVAAYGLMTRCLLDPSMDVVVDATRIERLAVTSDGLRNQEVRRARDARRDGGALPRVVVIAKDTGVFGHARMLETLRESEGGRNRYSVCRTMADARCWLGLSDEPSAASLRFEHA